jgi:hypothetical protein
MREDTQLLLRFKMISGKKSDSGITGGDVAPIEDFLR